MVIKILASNFDTFRFQRAFIADNDGRPAPRAIVSGVECDIDSKESLLNAKLAVCQPTDDLLAQHWPVYTDVEIDGARKQLPNITDNPQVVAAAQHFRDLAVKDQAEPGMEL